MPEYRDAIVVFYPFAEGVDGFGAFLVPQTYDGDDPHTYVEPLADTLMDDHPEWDFNPGLDYLTAWCSSPLADLFLNRSDELFGRIETTTRVVYDREG